MPLFGQIFNSLNMTNDIFLSVNSMLSFKSHVNGTDMSIEVTFFTKDFATFFTFSRFKNLKAKMDLFNVTI